MRSTGAEAAAAGTWLRRAAAPDDAKRKPIHNHQTGTGLEDGAGPRYSTGPMIITGSVRTLIAQEESGYEEWGASGAIRIDPGSSGRGLSLSITPTWGAAGSSVDQLWTLTDTSRFVDGEFEAERRLEAELGYGIGVPGTRGLVASYAGLSLGESANRTYRTGARWNVAPEATVGLDATREERGEEDPVNAVVVRAQVRW